MKGVPLLAGLNLVPRLGSAQQPCPGETRALKNRREWESAPPGNPKKNCRDTQTWQLPANCTHYSAMVSDSQLARGSCRQYYLAMLCGCVRVVQLFAGRGCP
jgi:hypothetical protein